MIYNNTYVDSIEFKDGNKFHLPYAKFRLKLGASKCKTSLQKG